MINDPKLRRLAERIKTTKKRYSTVVNYRSKTIKEEGRTKQRIVKIIVNMLETGEEEKHMQTLNEETAKLLSLIEKDKKSLKTLLDVINHPRHLPVIRRYFNNLDPKAKIKFQVAVNRLDYLLEEIRSVVENELLADIDTEMSYILKFRQTNNFVFLVEYIRYFRDENNALERVRSELTPHLKTIRSTFGFVRQILNKPVEFEEDHKKAAAAFIIILNLFVIFIPLFHQLNALHSIFSIISRGEFIGERILQVHDLDGSLSSLLNNG